MGGFNSVEGDALGTFMYADNVSFDGTPRGDPVTLDGQLLIGSTAAPHIRVGNLTSLDNSITITNGEGTIDLAASESPISLTITGDDAIALSPVTDNWNILGQQAGTIPVMESNGTALTASLHLEDRSWTTPFIVDTSTTVGLRGTFSTIASALTAASSGQTIYIRPGSYTENLTLKAGVNLAAYEGSELTPNVTIIGNATASFAGSCAITGIRLQTNGSSCLTVSGSSATIVHLESCYLNATNADAITYSSSGSSSIRVLKSQANLGTTGIKLFNHTSSGGLSFYYCFLGNTGESITNSTISSGVVNFLYCDSNCTVNTSGSSNIGVYWSNFDLSPQNVSVMTIGGSGVNTFYQCTFRSGNASAISVGSTLSINNCIVDSTNTNVITGSGSMDYGTLTFPQNSAMNVSTMNGKPTNTGSISFDAGTNMLSTFTEGTYSPTVLGSGTSGTPTYTAQLGRYVQFNKRIFVYHIVVWSAISGSPTGNLLSGGLPFTSENTSNISNAFTPMWGNNGVLISGSNNIPVMRITANNTQLQALTYSQTVGGLANLAIATSGSIACEGWYTST